MRLQIKEALNLSEIYFLLVTDDIYIFLKVKTRTIIPLTEF